MALKAYRRALEIGRTFDRRTNIVLIDQDLLGKTSLRRYLRGESFVRDEARTNGIEAEVVAWELLRSSKERSDRPQLWGRKEDERLKKRGCSGGKGKKTYALLEYN